MSDDFDVGAAEAVNEADTKDEALQAGGELHTLNEPQQTEKANTQAEETAAQTQESDMMHHVFTELREIHKICQNFQAGRIRNAEAELDKYHEIDKGRAFDDILRDIARIYIDHEQLPNMIDDEILRRRVNNILLDIQQVLDSYNVHIQKSKQGNERKLRLTHVTGYTDTADPKLSGRISESVQTGFSRENTAIIQELVKIYRLKD